MSLSNNVNIMKVSFEEAKDIINNIFTELNAPGEWFVTHMTFDELVVALERLLGMLEDMNAEKGPHIECIVNTWDANATEDDILLNKSAFVKGERIVGNIESLEETEYMPTTVDIVISKKKYLEGNQIIKGDENLIPDNIKPGVTIFNVTNPIENAIYDNVILDKEHPEQTIIEGWHKEGIVRIQLEQKIVMPGKESQIIEPSDDHVLGSVIVEGDGNLVSENIRYGTTIFGVPGDINVVNTYDGDAVSSDIVSNKTAYAKGQKIIGSMPEHNIGDVILDEELAEQRIEEGHHQNGNVRIQIQEKTVQPSNQDKVVEPDDKHVLSRVHVEGDEDLIPENIRKDTIIFGVRGTLEEITKYNIVYVVNLFQKPAYKQTIEYDRDFNIISDIPNTDEYEFKGWARTAIATIPEYTPGQSIHTNLADKGDTLVLYAVLEESGIDPNSEIEIIPNFTNGGQGNKGILRNDHESCTVTIRGGCASNGKYKNITREWEFLGYSNFIDHRTENDTNEYTLEFEWDRISINVLKITHTDKNGNRKVKVAVLAVLNENGVLTGTFKIVDPLGCWFDSGWIVTPAIRGCYVKNYRFKVAPSGHGNNYDCFAIFGKLGNNKNKILYDFGSDTNLNKEPNLAKLGTNYMVVDNKYVELDPNIRLTSGDISDNHEKSDTLTKQDNVRQCRFFAYTTIGHRSCVDPSHTTIEYEVEYEFDEQLWESDGENFGLTYEDVFTGLPGNITLSKTSVNLTI